MWEHLIPMITRTHDLSGNKIPGGAITFPRDGIEVLRCRAFTFEQKVVNRWFHHRTVLIGDAAHAFPPFGGQGIACGVRDAHGFAWRLSLLLTLPHPSTAFSERILGTWEGERRQGVDDSTCFTMANGKLVTEEESWIFFFAKTIFSVLRCVPFVGMLKSPAARIEARGYKPVRGGFFLERYGGGGKLAQIYLHSSTTREPFLSDELLGCGKGLMTLLVIDEYTTEQAELASRVVRDAKIHPFILSADNTVHFVSQCQSKRPNETFSPTPLEQLIREKQARHGYDEGTFFSRLGMGAKYVLVRPDFYIFATAANSQELGECLLGLRRMCEEELTIGKL